eukprot:scaffold147707_cov31-Tisochrysis_lutea.AAC.3
MTVLERHASPCTQNGNPKELTAKCVPGGVGIGRSEMISIVRFTPSGRVCFPLRLGTGAPECVYLTRSPTTFPAYTPCGSSPSSAEQSSNSMVRTVSVSV